MEQKKQRRGRPELGVRQISIQIRDDHLRKLDAKCAEAGLPRSVWLRQLFDRIL